MVELRLETVAVVLVAALLALQGGSCSAATARAQVLQKNVQVGPIGKVPIPIAPGQVDDVFCADLTGDHHTDMTVTVFSGGTAGDIAWLIFVRTGAGWRLALNRSGYKLAVFVAGRDVVESQPIYRRGDPNCCPTGGFNHARWRWNGRRFVSVRRWHDRSLRP